MVCPQASSRLDSKVFGVEENSLLSYAITISCIQQYDSVIIAFNGWLLSKIRLASKGMWSLL